MTTARASRAQPGSGAALDPLDEFLDLAGHELRTPLTALKGQVQLMQRRLRRLAERETDLAELGKMMYQIERLNHELDIYLEASHITRGRFELVPGGSDLATGARRLVDTYTAAATAHTLRFEGDAVPVVGTWDTRRLLMALEVLLANAMKFSRSGDVTVRVTREADVARVEVADRGIGVPPAERRLIFEAYEHASNAENAGAGLGLYVARETIRRHRGRMGVRSRSGGGSVFWFTVPLAPVPIATRPRATAPARVAAGRRRAPAATRHRRRPNPVRAR
jgi:two-component system CheB/CheR fusion protein